LSIALEYSRNRITVLLLSLLLLLLFLFYYYYYCYFIINIIVILLLLLIFFTISKVCQINHRMTRGEDVNLQIDSGIPEPVSRIIGLYF